MKAIVLKKHGGVENLILTDLPIPTTVNNEVLIAAKAISINPTDTYIRSSEQLDYVFDGERPRILGWDISGTITKVGENVTDFKVGDEVFGLIKSLGHDHGGHGKAYAEYVTAPAKDITLKPANISHEEAAAASMAALTAWQPLSKAGINIGDRILITGAGGGVGHYAIQIAKHFGAYVIALASAGKKEFVLSLGADEHIDYKSQNFEDILSMTPVDLVLELLRDDHISRSLNVLRPGGKLISLWSMVQGTPWETKAQEKKVIAYYNAVKSDGNDMKKIAELMKKGKLRSHISQTFRLEDMGLAHLELEKDNVQGKIVISLQ